jgi:hypothetical protein
LKADPAEYAILLAEMNNAPKSMRERLVELMFDKFKVPALFLAKNAVSRAAVGAAADDDDTTAEKEEALLRAVQCLFRAVTKGESYTTSCFSATCQCCT